MTQPRKSARYVPEIPILLRDAELRVDELSDPDRLRARTLARDELFRMYWEAERAGGLSTLAPGVRRFCEEMKRLNGGKLPARKGGRPRDEHRRLLICQKVQARINAGEGVVRAMENVAASERPPLPYTAVRDIWYNPSPEWQRWKRLAIAEWAIQTGELPSPSDQPGRKRQASA